MGVACRIAGCKGQVPAELEPVATCVQHFTLEVERRAGEMRLEVSRGQSDKKRRTDIVIFVREEGERLARIGTSTPGLSDELKARILATFLTLMNLREKVDQFNRRDTSPAQAASH
ncbi:MAG TPA: hypothetical protein VGA40_03135 [Candidatus Acidoferrales bacterium]